MRRPDPFPWLCEPHLTHGTDAPCPAAAQPGTAAALTPQALICVFVPCSRARRGKPAMRGCSGPHPPAGTRSQSPALQTPLPPCHDLAGSTAASACTAPPPSALGPKGCRSFPCSTAERARSAPERLLGRSLVPHSCTPATGQAWALGCCLPPRAVYRTGQQPLRSPTGWWHTHTPSLSSTLRSGREAGPGMHARPGANSMHIPRQVPLGKRKFGYVDLRMQSSRLAAWCCLLFQGLFWL